MLVNFFFVVVRGNVYRE